MLAGIGFSLFYVDEETDQMLLLGTDNDMNADWDNGVFYDNFRGVWGSAGRQSGVHGAQSFDGEDYNLYSVPILLNGEAYNLAGGLRVRHGGMEHFGSHRKGWIPPAWPARSGGC